MGATKKDIEKYGPLTCACPLCDRLEQDCCCDRGDVFEASYVIWQRDYDEIQQLRAELKAEREALQEICETYCTITDAVYQGRTQVQHGEWLQYHVASNHIERLGDFKC